jgi:hypothetical protein
MPTKIQLPHLKSEPQEIIEFYIFELPECAVHLAWLASAGSALR